MGQFVVIMAQGRSGSTLLLRMLNAVPGVRIAGENNKAMDHLRTFLECFSVATSHHHSEFFSLAWMLPCSIDELERQAAQFVKRIFNPDDMFRLVGFKEIRYGRGTYDELCRDISFLRKVWPGLKIVFNTRRTEDAVWSDFWRLNPRKSRKTLNCVRANFERFAREYPLDVYTLPYEELDEHSPAVSGLFDFLHLEFNEAARSELGRRLR